MRDSFWNKRIPTLFGLILLLIGVGATTYLTQTGVIFNSHASPGHTPQNIRITNMTDTSFTVSYTTSDKVPAVISYAKDKNLSQTAIDDRNQQIDSLTAYRSHHITLKNLSPGTKYYFSITSGPDTFLNNGNLFEATTPQRISSQPTNQQPIAGRVITSNGKDLDDAIVYVKTDTSQTISVLVKGGKYLAPLNSLRTEDLTSYINLAPDALVKLLVVNGLSQSNIVVLAKQISPVPTITLSQDYDFTSSVAPVASSSAQIGFPSFTATSSGGGNDPSISSPKNNESFTDQRPVFRGTAQPNTNVTITIHSDDAIEEKVTTDGRGNWSFRPSKKLSPGKHTITITTRDKFGILKTITQSFIINASGSQVDQSATGSASPIAQISPTSTPTPTPTSTPTATPTIAPTQPIGTSSGAILLPTPTPTIIAPTAGPEKGGAVAGAESTLIPTQGKIESPGSSSSTVIGLGAIITTAAGVLLFLLARGKTSV